MSNDATAVVLTPAVFSAVRRSKAEPLPNLFACAFIANAASFVLPISNPANLVVFRTQMPPLGHWIAAFGLPSMLSIASTYLVLRWAFRRDLRCAIPREQRPTRLTGNGRLVLIGIVLMGVILLAASAMKKDLGPPVCVCSVLVSCIVLARARTNPIRILRDISWSVLPLVAGLFILVEAIDSIGAMKLTAAAMQWAERLPAITGALLTAGAVGAGSNIVNNLPLGLIAGSTLKLTHAHGLIANAVLIAVDLGPNLSVTGSLATILWLIARRFPGFPESRCAGHADRADTGDCRCGSGQRALRVLPAFGGLHQLAPNQIERLLRSPLAHSLARPAERSLQHIRALRVAHRNVYEPNRLCIGAACGAGDTRNSQPNRRASAFTNPRCERPGNFLAHRPVLFDQLRGHAGECRLQLIRRHHCSAEKRA
jgi:hypothetical protein